MTTCSVSSFRFFPFLFQLKTGISKDSKLYDFSWTLSGENVEWQVNVHEISFYDPFYVDSGFQSY